MDQSEIFLSVDPMQFRRRPLSSSGTLYRIKGMHHWVNHVGIGFINITKKSKMVGHSPTYLTLYRDLRVCVNNDCTEGGQSDCSISETCDGDNKCILERCKLEQGKYKYN